MILALVLAYPDNEKDKTLGELALQNELMEGAEHHHHRHQHSKKRKQKHKPKHKPQQSYAAPSYGSSGHGYQSYSGGFPGYYYGRD